MERYGVNRISLVAALLFVAFVLSFAGGARADFTFGQAVNLGPTVNSIANEQAPSISADGLELYFSDHPGAPFPPGGYGASDLWVTTRPTKDDPWGAPMNLGPVVNSSAQDEHPSISADGLTLYFGSNRMGGSGTHDLWVTTRPTKDAAWTEPVNLGSTVNSAHSEWDPEISADGLSLYFADYLNYRPGGQGSWDLYVTRRDSVTGFWGTPANLGLPVNSPSIDASPSISADNLVLFLNSERPGGPGGSDIWMTSRMTGDADWATPSPLGPGVNASGFDATPEISTDGSTLYFSSERPGGSGNVDLWQAAILPVVDFNGDGRIDGKEVLAMTESWGTDDPQCDIGPMPWGDGVVDGQDLKILAQYVPALRRPGADAVEVPCDTILSWTGSPLADTYDVYMGTSMEDVSNADCANPLDVLVSQGQDANSYDPAGPLEFGQTYYVRIDEIGVAPDLTIRTGFVSSFTTERYSYPLDDVTATSNTTSAGGEGPENTVNGSGLDADGQHSNEPTDMWLGTSVAGEPVQIRFDFDQVYKLHEARIWNHNTQWEVYLGNGLENVTVEYSTDGLEWTVLGDFQLAQAPGSATYAGETIDLSGVEAQSVRLTVASNYGAAKYGLSEVQFLYIPTRP